MSVYYSPLRYPGGKAKIAPVLEEMLKTSGRKIYAEPFCGGAGTGLYVLMKSTAEKIILNDADFGIYCFWKSILYQTDAFIELVRNTPVTIEEWQNQRDIYANAESAESCDELSTGFATFYLNRTNVSGILKAGVIGGKSQNGKYKIDARFNRENLIKKIEKIAERKNDITVSNLDFEDFIAEYGRDAFMYFDPPYFIRGKELYTKYFTRKDHIRLRKSLEHANDFAVTYDNDPFIRKLYEGYAMQSFSLSYSAGTRKEGNELMIASSEKYLLNKS